MERFRNSGGTRRRLLCAVLAATLAACGLTPRAAAQHEGHGQHTEHAPKKRPAAKRAPARAARARKPSRAPARATTTRRAARSRRAGRQKARTTGRRATPAQGTTAAPRPATQTATPVETHEGHEGHTQRPVPTPSPSPAATPHAHDPRQPQEHRHEQPPATTPEAKPAASPSPRPAASQPPVRQQQSPQDHSGHQMPQPQSQTSQAAKPAAAGPALRLEDLEAMALSRNPTLAQAEAAVRAAEGRRRQAGMFPNPTVGYSAENVSVRRPSETTEHLFFVEQTFPLGGKLSKARRVFAGERGEAEAVAASQRQRVVNEVRTLYFETLGAERLVELRAELARLAREAVEISKELYNVGQADRPDLLEIEIEAQRAEIEQLKAENDREQAWQLLAAAVGDPALRPAPLAGTLEDAAATLDERQLLPVILRDSPEVRAGAARVERARAAVASARAERVPDLFVRGGAGYNQERAEAFNGGRTGAVVAIETGVRLPLWNRNQGGIAAAEAELAIAERDVERLRLALGARLASSLRAHRNARQVAEKYRTGVIPAARAAYEMYLGNFRQMAASYPQVLIAQRTLFQVQVEYARALVEVRRSLVTLRGFLITGGALDAVGSTGEGFRAGSSDDRDDDR